MLRCRPISLHCTHRRNFTLTLNFVNTTRTLTLSVTLNANPNIKPKIIPNTKVNVWKEPDEYSTRPIICVPLMPRYLIDLSAIFLFERKLETPSTQGRASPRGGMGRWIDPSWWTHSLSYFLSSQCSTTCLTMYVLS